MDSPIHGEVPLEIGERTVTVCFDWLALARIEQHFRGEEFNLMQPAHLAVVAAYGLQKHQPGEFTAESLMELSPAFWPTHSAVSKAFTFAYWGIKGVPTDLEKRLETSDAKKNGFPKSLWRRLSRRRAAAAV